MPAKVPFTSTTLTYTASVNLETEQYQFTMDWNFRSQAWYASVVRASDQAQLVAYRRVSPGSLLLDVPEGQFRVRGVDPYVQGSFQTGDLLVLFFTPEEIAEITARRGADPDLNILPCLTDCGI